MLELRNANLKFKIANLTLGLIVDWVVLTHPGDTNYGLIYLASFAWEANFNCERSELSTTTCSLRSHVVVDSSLRSQ